MTMSPIRSGLMPYVAAKPRAIGAIIATAPGLTAPTAVSTAAIPNMIQGMAAIRPRTARTAIRTSQSIVRTIVLGDREQVGDPDQGEEEPAWEARDDVLG